MKLLVARHALFTVVLALAPNLYAVSPSAQAGKPVTGIEGKQQLDLIARDYYQVLARFNPLDATLNGDNRFDDQLGLSIGPAQRTRQFALYRKFLARLQTIKRGVEGVEAGQRLIVVACDQVQLLLGLDSGDRFASLSRGADGVKIGCKGQQYDEQGAAGNKQLHGCFLGLFLGQCTDAVECRTTASATAE